MWPNSRSLMFIFIYDDDNINYRLAVVERMGWIAYFKHQSMMCPGISEFRMIILQNQISVVESPIEQSSKTSKTSPPTSLKAQFRSNFQKFNGSNWNIGSIWQMFIIILFVKMRLIASIRLLVLTIVIMMFLHSIVCAILGTIQSSHMHQSQTACLQMLYYHFFFFRFLFGFRSNVTLGTYRSTVSFGTHCATHRWSFYVFIIFSMFFIWLLVPLSE